MSRRPPSFQATIWDCPDGEEGCPWRLRGGFHKLEITLTLTDTTNQSNPNSVRFCFGPGMAERLSEWLAKAVNEWQQRFTDILRKAMKDYPIPPAKEETNEQQAPG